mmetsp:Transcript_19596/g.48979  ORF Transcript_19596/g.48979 Transcript_19596/m.48979 type:complete len:127 (+) Transcript_19596:114-494(+)
MENAASAQWQIDQPAFNTLQRTMNLDQAWRTWRLRHELRGVHTTSTHVKTLASHATAWAPVSSMVAGPLDAATSSRVLPLRFLMTRAMNIKATTAAPARRNMGPPMLMELMRETRAGLCLCESDKI